MSKEIRVNTSENSEQRQDAAFNEFAEAVMPWILEDDKTDAERLVSTTARSAFDHGWQAHAALAAPTSNSAEFDGIGQPEPDGEVMEMWICESRSCVLRIGQLYRFKVDPTCSSCAPLAAEAAEAYGPIDARWCIDREPRAIAPDEPEPEAANSLESGGIGVPAGWEPAFDAMTSAQEALARQFCAEIGGLKGEGGRAPDPVRLLEMAEALYLAERNAAYPPAPTSERST